MARVKNFRLQKVLEFKKHLEVMGMLELHKAQSEKTEDENVLNNLVRSKDDLLHRAKDQFTEQKKIDLNDLKLHFSYLDQLQNSIEHQNKTIKNLKTVVEQKRTTLNSAVKERKIIQTLKDQFDMRRKQEIKKAENEQIDEIAVRKNLNMDEQGV